MQKAFFDNIQFQILKHLNQANDNILIAMAWFTNQLIFDLICEKASKGVKIELILLNDLINNSEEGLNFQELIDLGAKIYFPQNDKIIHHKFCLIDDKTLITGSYNWTYFAETKNFENIVIFKDEIKIINDYKTAFLAIKKQSKQIQNFKSERSNIINQDIFSVKFQTISDKQYHSSFNDRIITIVAKKDDVLYLKGFITLVSTTKNDTCSYFPVDLYFRSKIGVENYKIGSYTYISEAESYRMEEHFMSYTFGTAPRLLIDVLQPDDFFENKQK